MSELEEGNLPLEKSLQKYKEGVELTRFCGAKLGEAEKEIKELVKTDKGFSLRDTDI